MAKTDPRVKWEDEDGVVRYRIRIPRVLAHDLIVVRENPYASDDAEYHDLYRRMARGWKPDDRWGPYVFATEEEISELISLGEDYATIDVPEYNDLKAAGDLLMKRARGEAK